MSTVLRLARVQKPVGREFVAPAGARLAREDVDSNFLNRERTRGRRLHSAHDRLLPLNWEGRDNQCAPGARARHPARCRKPDQGPGRDDNPASDRDLPPSQSPVRRLGLVATGNCLAKICTESDAPSPEGEGFGGPLEVGSLRLRPTQRFPLEAGSRRGLCRTRARVLLALYPKVDVILVRLVRDVVRNHRVRHIPAAAVVVVPAGPKVAAPERLPQMAEICEKPMLRLRMLKLSPEGEGFNPPKGGE